MEGPSQDDGALITEQIIEELRQEREREEMEEREWDSKDLNANFVDLLLTIEEDVPSGTLSFKFTNPSCRNDPNPNYSFDAAHS